MSPTFNRTPSWSPITDEGEAGDHHMDLDSFTPATTPGSIVSSPLPKNLDPLSPWFQDETRCFLQDLSNFLPLGCITSKASAFDTDAASSWSEVYSLPNLQDVCLTLQDHVRKLCAAGWTRVLARVSTSTPPVTIYRIYLLPGDVGNRFIDRKSKRLLSCLENLLRNIDVSPQTWQSDRAANRRELFDVYASSEPGSLFYMFNSIPSPAPDAENIRNHHNREALEALLDSSSPLPGLRTPLYPYQRRSAGLMLQRESEPRLHLDPRLEKRTAPDGTEYYFGAKDVIFLRHPRMYETGKGGILAETMGLGKTLMCIALILSTKGHLPQTPAVYNHLKSTPKVGSLAAMAVSAINRHSVPWKTFFEQHEAQTGESLTRCISLLEESPPTYEIPQIPLRFNRATELPPPKVLTLAATTIIVVPRNLCSQWQSELQKHTTENALSVLVMDDNKKNLPRPKQLRKYDVVLFSRSRFEQEIRDGSDSQGRRLSRQQQLACRCPYIGSSRTRDCTCVNGNDMYDSPLKYLHFLRIIIDEGHFFSNGNSTAAHVAEKLVEADHRWVVSGTPAKDLLGVEMDLYSSEAVPMALNDSCERSNILDQRRMFNFKEDTSGAIKSIGSLASHFLKVRPWAAGEGESPSFWDDYIYRHVDSRKRTYSGFSTSLSRTLEALVVKTQPEDVERDIDLPPLTHNIVRLKPSFYDKLTANLFTLVLTANAVTSERTDADYLFHKNSQKARYQLIHNLRQSAFFWTGFSDSEVEAAVQNGESYLEKDDTTCSEADRELLRECIKQGKLVLATHGWKALSSSHEIGLFLDQWPADSAEHWTFDGLSPLLTGASQLIDAQAHVNDRCTTEHPSEGLSGAGIRVKADAYSKEVGARQKEDGDKPVLMKLGVPTSSVNGEPLKKKASPNKSSLKKQSVLSDFKIRKPRKSVVKTKETPQHASTETLAVADLVDTVGEANVQDAMPYLPETSELRQTVITGTTSAKLSYLVSQIYELYQHEKILVFYEGDNVAYYIAQVLELLHIPHLIYAKSLNAAQKSDYIVRFDKESDFRVLLMDVQQAAFGLNLVSASRVFFVNPVCRPHIEAQAIKRAHRIGQTRPVIVETLILEGTIEEKMFERAKRMSRAEHKEAKVLEDDGGIKEIIQSARPLPITEEERLGHGQIAYLESSQQLWSRPLWATWNPGKRRSPVSPGDKKKRKTLEPTDGNTVETIGQNPVTLRPTKRVRLGSPVVIADSPVSSSLPQAAVDASLVPGFVSVFGGDH
ncbi:hypothetical protein MBLNU457_4867t1 [Dothideomycetes sp. NU457]